MSYEDDSWVDDMLLLIEECEPTPQPAPRELSRSEQCRLED